MKYLGFIGALTVAALALSPRIATAAPGPALPLIGGPSAISAGVFVPSGGDDKDRGGSTQLALNFRYTVPVPNPLVVPSRTVIDLGVQTGARNGGHSTVIPITIGQLVSANGHSPSAPGAIYVGGGIGAFVINQSGISSATRIGGFAELGYNVTDIIFADARYQFVDHANGLGITVGARF